MHTQTHRVPSNVVSVRHTDLALLKQLFPQSGPDIHEERSNRQQQGHATYLVAWHKSQPVGHGLVKWVRPPDDPIAPRLAQDCPHIEDLFVLEEMRAQGIGTQILQVAEELARKRGYRQIGLSAGAETDDRARKLYERLGYHDVGFGEFVERYEYIDEDGQPHVWQGTCIYLIKEIIS